jgi:hypothetical protein
VSMTWLERHKAQERRTIWHYTAGVAALVLIAVLALSTQGIAARLLHGLTT